MNDLKIFDYNGSKITFENNDKVMVNATEMAKGFDKRPVDWLRTDQAQGFVKELSNVRICTYDDLVNVKEGSPQNGGGTWMHEDVALEFARWLSPKFAIWCNDRIKELLTTGKTQLDTLTHPSRKQLAQWVIELEDQNEKLAIENKEKEKQLAIQAPKVLFADSVNTSQNSILIADLAKILKQNGIEIGEKRLFEWLRQNGYLCTKGNYRNMPTQKAMDLGLFEILERSLMDRKHDEVFVAFTTKVTGKGQIYFINKFLKDKAA